jgi:hypothetical protein
MSSLWPTFTDADWECQLWCKKWQLI